MLSQLAMDLHVSWTLRTLLLALGVLVVRATYGLLLAAGVAGCALAAPSPEREARTALERWLQAYQTRSCQEALDGLARMVVEGQYQVMLASCQEDPLPWTRVAIGSAVEVQPNRVIFQGVYHLPSGTTQPGYLVMHREAGQWRFAWDVLRPVAPTVPEPREHRGYRILLGPGWERVDRFTLLLMIEPISPRPAAKEGTLCARLRLADGRRLALSPCLSVTFTPTGAWQGDLVFPKPQIGDMAQPQRLEATLQFPEETLTFQFTLRVSP